MNNNTETKKVRCKEIGILTGLTDEVTNALYCEDIKAIGDMINEYVSRTCNILVEFAKTIYDFGFPSEDAKNYQAYIIEQSNALVKSMKNGDMIMLADTLRYDVKELLDLYQDLLSQ